MKAIKLQSGICFYSDDNVPTEYSKFVINVDDIPEKPDGEYKLDIVDDTLQWVAVITPPPEPTIDERILILEKENTLLRAQITAQSEQMDFYEECMVEMAEIVYA